MSQVLALKYRPSTFDKLIGQDSITQTLTLALDQKRLSHAYLFSGLRGSGKTSTARIFSKALVCDNGPTAKPCEVCENCKAANENKHIDIIEMDAASSRKIDDIRDLIEQTKYKPNNARFKIFIIDEVHMLTKEAFNALLKTLEEPPEYVKFILATTDPLKLPTTILSRTQHFRFKKISKQDINHHLSHILNLEKVQYETDAIEMLSRTGNGSLRDTLTLLDQAIIYTKGFVDAKSTASMLGLLDPEYLDEIFDTIIANDKKKILEVIKTLETHESEVVIDELVAYLKDLFFQEDARLSTLLCERFFKILSDAKNLLFLNADSGFVLSLVFFKMMEATDIKEIDEMIEILENETKQIISHRRLTPENKEQKVAQTIASEKKEETPKNDPLSQENEKKNQTDVEKFKKLCEMLYDRNYQVGECFKNSIEFVSFENGTLSLISCAKDECKNSLRHASGIIKHFVQDIFGFETKIKMAPCNKKKDELEDKITNEEFHANEQSSGAMEDIEMKEKDKKDEVDSNDIMQNPFVQKATELFSPTKIIVKSKV